MPTRFGSLGLTRRQALWAAKALGRAGDQDDDLPLFRPKHRATFGNDSDGETGELTDAFPHGARARRCAAGDAARARRSSTTTAFSTCRCARIRPRSCAPTSRARDIIRNEELRTKRSGARVSVSGLVTIRQRPGSASGVIFMTIEDETAVANIIVWPKMFERFRPVVLGARYVAVTGELQHESGVIHVVAATARRSHPAARPADRGCAADRGAGARRRGQASRMTRISTAAPAAAAMRRASPRSRRSRICWRAISMCPRAARRIRPRAAAAAGPGISNQEIRKSGNQAVTTAS